MGPEAKIEAAVCKYAKEKGCYVRKFSSPAHRGVPDRLFITPRGTVFFIEFKAPGKLPTALQMREMGEIREHNTYAFFADSVKKGKSAVDAML